MLRPILRGARLRCPACGVGRMTPGVWAFGRLRDACPRCGVRFEPSRGEWSGALMFAQGTYGAIALLVLFPMLLMGAGLAPILVWIALSCVVLPILTYRNFKGAWIGAMWGAHPW